MFRIIPEGGHFSEYVLLRDGESLFIRAADAKDIPALEAFLKTVSRASLQLRFMGAVACVPRSVIETLCTGEPRDRLCLLAISGQERDPRIVGFGNYLAVGAHGQAEVAFLVHDDFQGRGISTLLLERLAGIAAANGFVGFEAEILYENQPMLNVLRDSGFEICQALDSGSIHVQFPVSGLASLHERAELRDRIAAANSLVPLLQPKTVAVVGASRDLSAVGSLIFRSILLGNFSGSVYPVNNQTAAVHGVRAYASVRDLPERADLVVVAVPAARVLEVAEEALVAGTKGLLVVTSGFAESGPEGAAAQKRLLELVKSHGARLIGPNCLGLMNTHPEVSLNASLAPSMPPRGRIGFYSHSAALGLVILNYAAERGLGFSIFVSAGNRADVSGNDLLQFWEEDPSTDLALLYLETFGNPRRFARVARRIACRKPVLCVKSARSKAGRDLARAHIGAVAQSDTKVDMLFRQAGVIRADTLEEMFDAAVLLAHQPLPRGHRVAVISNSGGVLTICADACESHGLELAGPAAIDVGPFATVETYEAAVQRALEHPEVDALIAIYACVGNCDPQLVGRGIRRGVLRAERNIGISKPALLCLMGAAGVVRFGVEADESDVSTRRVFPSYRFPESAALALSRAAQYAAFRAQPRGRLAWYEDADPGAARRQLNAILDSSSEERIRLEGVEAAGMLRCFGIETVPGKPDAPPDSEAILLQVSSDPSFGPLIRLQRRGVPPVDRITPLTDQDIREILETVEIPAGSGVEELLGRVSQLIEELPWLCEMRAEIHGAAVGAGLQIGFCRHDSAPQ